MEYRFEYVRLQSFDGWVSHHVHPDTLAAAGFYYTKQIDRVRCFECSTEICRWEAGDDPMSEHQRWGGPCRFIRKQPCGNVPIGIDPSTIPPPRSRKLDVCGPYRIDYRPNAEADTYVTPSSSSQIQRQQHLPSPARLGVLGIDIVKKPDYPNFVSYEARLQSFAVWPRSLAQTKEQMADAGFFYTGVCDQTSCYHCGGGLKNWEPQDDPWTQHAKWFSTCLYVRLVKGQEFINTVTGKHVSPWSEKETLKWNLPSYIKKVEPAFQHKEESKEESVIHKSQTVEQQSIQEPESSTSLTDSFPNTTGISASCDNQRPIERKSIDDARVCKICYNKELGVVFLPCGHIVACVKCASGMMTCAVCREPVTMTVRAFFS